MKPIRVLVVDDHSVITDGIATLLDLQPDLEVVGTALSGSSALALCAELGPDVVLMDMSMPGMTGADATRRIISQNPSTRIIILTSFMDGPMVREAVAAGACGYLLKSIGSIELAEAVRSAVEGRSTLSGEVLRHLSGAGSPEVELTPRELDIVRLLSEGWTNKQIAAELSLSPGTVRVHVSNILAKLGVENRTAAAHYALSHGLVPPTD